MTLWHEGRLAVLDLETTSADPDEARIVTAAVGFVGGGQPTDVVTLMADPGVEIPAEATAIHGISTERARAEGRPPDEVLDIVLGTLDRRPDGAPVVVFNGRYDLTVGDREARRYGLPALDAERPLYVVDPLVCDKHLHRYRQGSRKLNAMCAHYGAKLEAAHLAGADAIAAGRLAWAIAKRGKVIRRTRDAAEIIELQELEEEWERVRHDLPRLHDAQQRWAAAQAASLEQYFRELGEPKHVDRAWPVVPLQPEPHLAIAEPADNTLERLFDV